MAENEGGAETVLVPETVLVSVVYRHDDCMGVIFNVIFSFK